MHRLYRELVLSTSIEEAWNFFSNPHNLKEITPKHMGFEIISKHTPDTIYNGLTIQYKIKPLLGIPMKWKTLIKDVVPFASFTDIQVEGPYKTWEHKHVFTKLEKSVLMQDTVIYELSMGPLGKLAHGLLVKDEIRKIFDYRQKTIANIF